MISRKCVTAVSALLVFNIFLGIIRFVVMCCLNFCKSALPVMSLRVGVENDKDASSVILTGKWSESSSKSGSWCMEKLIDFSIITSKISGLLL